MRTYTAHTQCYRHEGYQTLGTNGTGRDWSLACLWFNEGQREAADVVSKFKTCREYETYGINTLHILRVLACHVRWNPRDSRGVSRTDGPGGRN